jgi:hypothetical protein
VRFRGSRILTRIVFLCLHIAGFVWHSVFNDDAPVIDSTEIAALRADPQCRANMLRSFARMLSFYGFEQIEEAEEEQVAADGIVDDGDANSVARAQQHQQPAADAAVSSAADGNVAETGSQSDLASARMDSGDGHVQGIGGGSDTSESPDSIAAAAGKDAAPLFAASSSSPQKQHPKRHRQNTSTLPVSSTSSALTSSSPPPPSPASASQSPQPPSESQQAQPLPRPIVAVRPSAHFKRRARASWAASFDHNHLRITRILKSLRIFGLHAHAQAFFDALVCEMEMSFCSRFVASCRHYSLVLTRTYVPLLLPIARADECRPHVSDSRQCAQSPILGSGQRI